MNYIRRLILLEQEEEEEGRSSFKILTGTSAGKYPLGRRVRRWEDNIKMDLKKKQVTIRGIGLILRIGNVGGPF